MLVLMSEMRLLVEFLLRENFLLRKKLQTFPYKMNHYIVLQGHIKRKNCVKKGGFSACTIS